MNLKEIKFFGTEMDPNETIKIVYPNDNSNNNNNNNNNNIIIIIIIILL